MAPGVPTPTPISALPEITACKVSPAPCVPKLSRTMPCFWKIPAFMPSVGTWLDQASIWPTATLSVSCAPAGAAKPHEAATERTAQKPRKDFHLWPFMVFLLPVLPDGKGRLVFPPNPCPPTPVPRQIFYSGLYHPNFRTLV